VYEKPTRQVAIPRNARGATYCCQSLSLGKRRSEEFQSTYLSDVADANRSDAAGGKPVQEFAPKEELVCNSHKLHCDGGIADDERGVEHNFSTKLISKVPATEATDNGSELKSISRNSR
jgi:hypothetical protein